MPERLASFAIQWLCEAVAAGQLVSVAAGSARVRGCWSSWGSIAAVAARDGGCWNSLVLLRRKAVAAGAARFSRCCCSARLRLPVQLLSFAAQGRGPRPPGSSVKLPLAQRGRGSLEQLGSSTADAARDGGCRCSSDQMPCLVFVCRSSSCQEWLEAEAAGAARINSSATLRLPEHIMSDAACMAAQFSRGAIPMLPSSSDQLPEQRELDGVGCRWNSLVQLAVAARC